MSVLEEVLSAVSGDLPDKLVDVMHEATALRDSVKQEEYTPVEGPAELHDSLLRHRKAMDRVEELAAKLGRLKARADRWVSDRKDVLEDAETHAEKLNEEYASAKEKNAHIALQTMDQKIAYRKAVRAKDEVYEALEYVRALHRGLDASRRDIDLRIRLITLQSSLER